MGRKPASGLGARVRASSESLDDQRFARRSRTKAAASQLRTQGFGARTRMVPDSSNRRIVDLVLEEERPAEALARSALSLRFSAPRAEEFVARSGPTSVAIVIRRLSLPVRSNAKSVTVLSPVPHGPCGAFSASARRLRKAREAPRKRRRSRGPAQVQVRVNFAPITPDWEIPPARLAGSLPRDALWSVVAALAGGSGRRSVLSRSPAAWSRPGESHRVSAEPPPIAPSWSSRRPRRCGGAAPVERAHDGKSGRARP
jgi:hypothetical protein